MAVRPNLAAHIAAVLWVVRTAHSLYGYETSQYQPLFFPLFPIFADWFGFTAAKKRLYVPTIMKMKL